MFRQRLMKMMAKPRKKYKPHLLQIAMKTKWNILRGDKVQVIDKYHPEKGKQGIVLKVIRKNDRVIVENVNLKTKILKGDPERGIKSRTIQREHSLPYSAVNLVDPVLGKPTRVYRKKVDGVNVRISRKSGTIIPKNPIVLQRRKPLSSITTSSCTTEEDAWAVSFVPKISGFGMPSMKAKPKDAKMVLLEKIRKGRKRKEWMQRMKWK